MSEIHPVKLIFAAKQKVEKGKTLRVSIKSEWTYYLQSTPARSIGMTLKKYRIAKTQEEESEMAKKYRVYRVREDPKTRYRYVTEILNQEEGKQLINKRYCQILICHHSLVRNPQEDFKNLLDEAERKQIRLNDEKNANVEAGLTSVSPQKKEMLNNNNMSQEEETKITKEPTHQSQSTTQGSSGNYSQMSGGQKNNGMPRQPRGRGKTHRTSNNNDGDISAAVFSSHELQIFRHRYPDLEITGKANDLYKISDVLQCIKDTAGIVYPDVHSLNKKLVKQLNQYHYQVTGQGNKESNPSMQAEPLYTSKLTPSYINVRCAISKKCRFAMWYKFDKNRNEEPINIKWFRTINNNHDLKHHKDAGAVY